MTTPAASTMRRDIVSAYLASAARVGSWAAISAITIRVIGYEGLALLALVRATLGLLNYTTLGLAPAMIHMLARTVQFAPPPSALDALPARPSDEKVLEYRTPPREDEPQPPDPVSTLYANGLVLAFLSALAAYALVHLYAENFAFFHAIPDYPPRRVITQFVWAMGLGMCFRICSDASSAMLQARRLIWLDNALLCIAEALWVWLSWRMIHPSATSEALGQIGAAYAVSALVLLMGRLFFAGLLSQPYHRRGPLRRSVMWTLLSFGVVVTISQLADFLYAPVDFILINRLIDPVAAAVYTPAVQIDAGLLLLVTGLSTVLLPHSALAHARGDRALLRRYYIRGTLASAAVLVAAALAVWLVAEQLLLWWLGDSMPQTRALLPLVLIHTIVGGSGAVGRAILIGMGRVKVFTAAALLAGVANVVLSYCFVRYFGWGLYGIIAGTIVVVVARAGVWLPWYVLKALREGEVEEESVDAPAPMV